MDLKRRESKHRGFFMGVAIFALAACAKNEGSVPIGAAPRSDESAVLATCAAQKLASGQTIVGPNTMVCRRDTEGNLKAVEIAPTYYLAAKRGQVRIAQVLAFQIDYAGNSPEPEVSKRVENEARSFLMATCAPMIENAFRRSNIRSKIIFQAYREADSLAVASKTSGALAENPVLFGDGKETPALNSAELDKAAKSLERSEPFENRHHTPTGLLKLAFGSDQGISVRDHVKPVTSGPLKAATAEQKMQFCSQVLERVAEQAGLSALHEGEKCSEKIGETSRSIDIAKAIFTTEQVFAMMKPVCDSLDKDLKKLREEKAKAKNQTAK